MKRWQFMLICGWFNLILGHLDKHHHGLFAGEAAVFIVLGIVSYLAEHTE